MNSRLYGRPEETCQYGREEATETRLIERGRFKVRDRDGLIYEVVEYQVITRLVMDSAIRTTKGGLVHQLVDGRSVSLVAESTFWLPDAERILTRVCKPGEAPSSQKG